MKKPLFFMVILWALVCACMTLWSVAPAHSHTPQRGDAYVTDTAYALPRNSHENRGYSAPQPQHYRDYSANPKRLWENDQSYQRDLNMLVRESAIRQRQYREKAQADISRLEAQRIENTNRHLSSLERLGDSRNTRYTDYSTLASRQNAREADYRARLSQIKSALELQQLREQNDLQKRIIALDDAYARKEPYRSWLAGRNPSR
ncbi:MAG TPA: hypothetical protein PLW48_06540 [Alphaproteobacteria bacterium]|nr:hypothetical protein [Rhodospirillaceae bacterium]HRJ66779.1 hypothetical protein [Alphaproteobacteria bacterium]